MDPDNYGDPPGDEPWSMANGILDGTEGYTAAFLWWEEAVNACAEMTSPGKDQVQFFILLHMKGAAQRWAINQVNQYSITDMEVFRLYYFREWYGEYINDFSPETDPPQDTDED